MLVAKISPAASFVSQSSPFGQPEIIALEYMAVISHRYVAGGSMQSDFQVMLGFYKPELNEEPASFTAASSIKVELTAEELSDWGTDDSFILNAVATKLATSVVEVIEKEHILGIL